MEISAMQGEEVAAPGGVVSGAAGTGQEHGIAAAPVTAGSCTKTKGRRGRVVIGLGVLAPDSGGGGQMPKEKEPEEEPVPAGAGNPVPAGGRVDPNLAFALFERDERIEERLEQKIARLEKRLDRIVERGRS